MTIKNLGQAAPAANTDHDLYTVPAGCGTVVSNLTVTNRGSAAAKIDVWLRVGGAVKAPHHLFLSSFALAGYDMLPTGGGITLSAGDVVTVRASTGEVTFQLSGEEALQ